ncbi:MAG: hypothetical protein B7Y65_03325, partial [Azorhizobium sp. 35-67-15]
MSPAHRLISRTALALALAWTAPVMAASDTTEQPHPKPAKSAPAKPTAKPAAAKSDPKKTDSKKTEAKKTEAKKTEAKKTDSKKTAAKPHAKPASAARTLAPAGAPAVSLSGELGQLRSAVTAAKNGRGTEALAMARELNDPVARSLVTWLVIRNAPNDLGFDGINAFLKDKPGWPTQSTLRRRAERMLLVENRSPDVIRAFFSEADPLSGEGKIALARAFAASGDRATTTALVREAWREDDLSESVEKTVMTEFGTLLTRADHKARADTFSYKPDTDRAMRAAARAGSDVVALTQARLAIARKDPNGAKLLAAVPFTLGNDP